MQNVYIQWMNGSEWQTTTTLSAGSSPGIIYLEMKNAQRARPDNRIRAVDHDGRLIDML